MIEIIKENFINPQDEYTPIPFWFWNDNLVEPEIVRQIHDFNNKGVKGFVIHPRIGIPKEIEYLSDRFMELVSCAVITAKELGMKVVLYDEAMYPSGSAHGMVVKKNKDFASKGLEMIKFDYSIEGALNDIKVNVKSNDPKDIEIGTENGRILLTLNMDITNLVSLQVVEWDSDNQIIPSSTKVLEQVLGKASFEAQEGNWSILVFRETYSNGHIRGIHFGEDDGEESPPASSDLLNLDAMKEFIRSTHDRYYEVLKEYFGTTIIGMFTDEPSIMGRGHKKGLKSWTTGFLNFYKAHGNKEEELPLLWFSAGEASKIARRKFDETIHKKMEETYYKPIYEWCNTHNIALTGHPESSEDIGLLKYFHIPAQDVVWRWVAPENGLALEGGHSTMAKCSSDGARHRGIRKNGNECFACCGRDKIEWSFSAEDMKWYMDWLFVRGVNLLFPHAFFYSIDGPRRLGERPPDVGPNNIWWPHYKGIANYMKRMSYLMTDSVNQAKIAVLCSAHHLPWKIVKPLYENQIEFNYLENELLLSKDCIVNSKISIKEQKYGVLVIEDNTLLDDENKDKIQTFINQGGKVFVYNPDNKRLPIYDYITISTFDEIPESIKKLVPLSIATKDYVPDLRVSHLVKDGSEFFVFVNEGEEEIHTTARLTTIGEVERFDAVNGTTQSYPVISGIEDDWMDIELQIKRRESVILYINKEKQPCLTIQNNKKLLHTIALDNNWLMGIEDDFNYNHELIPFNKSEEYTNYSGVMYYKNTFHLNKVEAGNVLLDLGHVYEIASVTINGCEVGAKLWTPYVFNISDCIKDGDNELVVEVHNTLANKYSNMSFDSGLVGPVRIEIYQ